MPNGLGYSTGVVERRCSIWGKDGRGRGGAAYIAWQAHWQEQVGLGTVVQHGRVVGSLSQYP